MKRYVFLPMLVLGLLVSNLSATIVSAADPTTLVPESAVAVVRVKAPEKTIAKLVSMADVVKDGFGIVVEQQASMIGVGIMNPALTGVDQSRDWWIAAFTRGDAEPVVAFIVPATDVAQMQSALDENLFFASFEDWAVYSQDEAAVNAVKETAAGDSGSFGKLLRDRSKATFDRGDISVMVNIDVITATYRTEIDQAKRDADAELENIPDQLPEIPGMKLDWIADLAPKFVNGAFTTLDEAEHFVEAIIVSDEGLKFDSTIDFVSEGKVSKVLSNSNPTALNLLSKLPAGHVGYFALGGGDIAKLQDFAFGIMEKLVEDPAKKAEMAEVLALSKEIEFKETASSFGLGDLATGLIRSVTLAQATPTETVKKTVRKSVIFGDMFDVPGVRQSMTLQEDAETYGSRSADIMILEQTFEGEDAQLGGLQQQIMTFMYGPEGIVTRVGYLADGYVQTLGGGTEGMKTALEAYDASANADNEAFKRDRSQLMANANLIGMMDLMTLVADGVKVAAASGLIPIPLTPEDVDGIGIEKSYLGFSMGCSSDGVEFSSFIPVQTVQNGLKMFEFYQSMQQPGAAF